MAEVWIVPGAPMEKGEGWRVWYSWPGRGAFTPGVPRVTLRGTAQKFAQAFDAFDPTPGFDRRMGVLSIRLDDPRPGALYEVTVPERGRPFRWRSLPASLGDGVSFLMSSCYWRNDDKEGRYGAGVTHLTTKFQPAFKLLMGDQLYQDWPLRLGVSKSPYEIYGHRYAEYWGDGVYRELLGSSPNFFACDDHEFWNNYPEPSPWAPWSLTSGRRREARDAARALFHRFQHGSNPRQSPFYSFAVDRVTFFVADARSERTQLSASPRFFFKREQWDALEAWARGLKGPGVLVLPQPMFQSPGGVTDYSLANFSEDYSRLCGLFQDTLDGAADDGQPHDILILSGDIHTGRHAVGIIKNPTRGEVHEFIASPASLVGPFQPFAKANVAPGKLFPQGRPSWSIHVTAAEDSPTIDNNVGHVRMSAGRNGRIRFEFEIWRVRPHDARKPWQRLLRAQPQAPLARIFRKEIELR